MQKENWRNWVVYIYIIYLTIENGINKNMNEKYQSYYFFPDEDNPSNNYLHNVPIILSLQFSDTEYLLLV